MKKIVLSLGIILMATAIHGATSHANDGAFYMTQMMKSMDYVQTFQAEVYLQKQSSEKMVSMNYRLLADNLGNMAAFVDTKPKRVEIQNKRGHFVIERGDVKVLKTAFPFDVPFRYFKKMALKDVTDNYKFVVSEKTADVVVVDMIPIGTAGRSIKEAMSADAPTKIRFTIDPKFYFLKQIAIYKKNQPSTDDIITFQYGAVTNKQLEKSPVFENELLQPKKLSIVVSKSVADMGLDVNGVKKYQIKEARYQNVVLNDVLKEDVFDEKAY